MTITVARTGVAPVSTEYDLKVDEQIREMEKQFSDLRAEGMLAVSSRPDGTKVQVNELDTEAEEIIFHSPLVGG